jgi:hypothetical protein
MEGLGGNVCGRFFLGFSKRVPVSLSRAVMMAVICWHRSAHICNETALLHRTAAPAMPKKSAASSAASYGAAKPNAAQPAP